MEDGGTGIRFEVDSLFLIGSPVGLFLRLRGISLAASALPKIRRVYNIYHPSGAPPTLLPFDPEPN